MSNREVMQQALEALENVNPSLVCEMAHHPKKKTNMGLVKNVHWK
jgi:hypothetical protein